MSIIANLLRKFFGKAEYRLLMVGLDASGRTTILYKMKLGEVVTTIPTIGFNVEELSIGRTNLTCWDVGGCDKIRPLWRHYYQNTTGVIFVVDSNDRERIGEAREELYRMMAEPELNDCILAIAINKRDLPNPMTVEEVETKLRVADLPVAIKQTFATAATTGDGLYPMFEWISEQSELKAKGAAPSQPAPKPVDEKPKTPQEELMERWLSVQDEPDEEFIDKLTSYKLESWDHRAHLRIAWVYLTKFGRRQAIPKIFDGIKNFIMHSGKANKTKFHETLTYFWVHIVHYAMEATKNPTGDFIGFLLMNPQLSNGGLFLEYYTKDHIMNNPEARSQMVLPDIKPLPSLVTGVGIDAAEDTTVTKAAVDALPKAAPNSDEEFIQQFEDKKLNRWNHECFLRVIFIYLNKLGRKEGVNKVFETFQEMQKGGFHYTITYFWITLIDYVKATMGGDVATFDDLIKSKQGTELLLNEKLYLKYYKESTIESEMARTAFAPPEQPLPTLVR